MSATDPIRTRFCAQRVVVPAAPAIELFLLDLDAVEVAPADARVLDATERERNARFVTPLLRHRDQAVRLWVRVLLAQRCNLAPEALVWQRGMHGKPSLMQPGDAQPLRFNLSHSQGIALIALSTAHDPGVDIECLRPFADDELDSLARAVLTSDERRALEALAADTRGRALLTAWTRKEACVKALGFGLTMPVQDLQVGLAGENAEVTAILPATVTEADTAAAVTPATDGAGAARTASDRPVPAQVRLQLRTTRLGDRAVCSLAWREPASD